MATVATVDGVMAWLLSAMPEWVWHGPAAVPMASDDASHGPSSDGGALDDQACLARIAAGDAHALRPIFDRWKLPLLSYFYRALGSRADAEDLTLQVFERVHRAAGRFRPGARFSTWLFAIARGELLHELRRRRRKPLVPVPPEELVDVAHAPGPTADMEEHLLHALQQLPERQRSALLLAASGELAHADIAAALGVSVNHLNVILHRARQALREQFQEKLP